MQVFISWSGRGRELAEAFAWWIPKVIQAARPFVSSQDISKGDFWRQRLGNVLAEYQFGLAILTKESIASPWLNFETGALSKNLGASKVMPILFGVDDADLAALPLNQFQNTKFEREDMRKLMSDLNGLQLLAPLSSENLNDAFDVWWPKLEERIGAILTAWAAETPKAAKPRPEDRLEHIELALGDITRMLRAMRASRRDERDNLWDGNLFGASEVGRGARGHLLRSNDGRLIEAWVDRNGELRTRPYKVGQRKKKRPRPIEQTPSALQRPDTVDPGDEPGSDDD